MCAQPLIFCNNECCVSHIPSPLETNHPISRTRVHRHSLHTAPLGPWSPEDEGSVTPYEYMVSVYNPIMADRQSQIDYVQSVLALNPIVLDVRSQEERDSGFLEGSVHVPIPPPPLKYDNLCQAAMANGAFAGLNTLQCLDKPIAVYCKKGIRSALAASILRAMGAKQVYDLGGAFDGPLAAYRNM